jgi:catechol 2,3-dioxygenase-like lactoylglutathione lyase family enzyme
MNLNQVVTDLDRSIAFYRLLGLRLIVHAPPHYARFECPNGDATFSLHLAEPPLNNGGVWIYFENEAVDKVVQELTDQGIIIEALPEDQSWLWREARLRDPDQHLVIIYHAGVNRKDPPWRLP